MLEDPAPTRQETIDETDPPADSTPVKAELLQRGADWADREQPLRSALAPEPVRYDVEESVADVLEFFDTGTGPLDPFLSVRNSPTAERTAAAEFAVLCGSQRPRVHFCPDGPDTAEVTLRDGTIVSKMRFGNDVFLRYTNAGADIDNVVVYVDERTRAAQPRDYNAAVLLLTGSEDRLNTDRVETEQEYRSRAEAVCMAALDFSKLCGGDSPPAVGVGQVWTSLPDGTDIEFCLDSGFGLEISMRTTDGTARSFFKEYHDPSA